MTEQIVSLLDQTLLFAKLHQAHKQQIASVLQRITFEPGQVIFNEGDPGDALYIIENGKVAVFVKNPQVGVAFELARLGSGQVFGEMALITEAPRNASVRALEKTQCLVLSTALFQKICQQLPAVTMGIAKTLAQRLSAVNKEQGISFVNLARMQPDPNIYQLVPSAILQRHKLIPLKMEGNSLTLAMVDPSNVMGIDDVRRCLHGIEIKPVAISEEDYKTYIKKYAKQDGSQSVGLAEKRGPVATDWRQLEIFSDAAEAAEDKRAATKVAGQEVVTILNQILAEGLGREASDIHIDSERHTVSVRFRVDGRLQQWEKSIPRTHFRPLVSRIKILSGMDIAEKRLPQDGRFSLAYKGKEYDMRVASMPVRGGERIAMRLLDSSSSFLELDNLILADKLAHLVRRMVFKPNGAVLVTGPTGSGKTTTLYSLLKERIRHGQDINVVTVEDPIEYDLSGVAQVQINEGAGLDFPTVLRGFLRHDPDIILVGETRDPKTAKIAMEASITGHLVLTSMHTNSAIGSVVRLKEMGIDNFLVANAVSGVVAQRLVRRCCPMCSKPFKYIDSVVENLKRIGVLGPEENPKLVKGEGCPNCNNTGFRGRVGVFEVLQVTEGLKNLIAEDVSISRLKEEANRGGMVSLAKYAGFLLKNGLTVPSEVLRILSFEG
ncbi:MAG: Flp pilus assembly complex ATPase component [Deltaproteobacteria bacterium]|nr:Flp pilus assembly complex ATPase component [Deltaproteobacteria bacterium]